jgi:ribonuclease J
LIAGAPALRVVPLGGVGLVGRNACLLVYGNDALLVDCGVSFEDDGDEVRKIVADFSMLDGLRLVGVVLTHGHMDHIGGLKYVLDRYPAPVFGTRFTLNVALARVYSEASIPNLESLDFRRVGFGETQRVGPFAFELIRMTHSFPENAAVYVTSDAGRVLFSGDFCLDPSPLDGVETDVARLRALGETGAVDLLLSDSTNSESERSGPRVSESQVALEIERVVGRTEGRVVVVSFASHIHRLDGALRAARRFDRKVCFLGRSLRTMWDVAVRDGLVDAHSVERIEERKLGKVPRGQVMIVSTGGQGEPNAGLTRMVVQPKPSLAFQPRDVLILSCRTIPGRELAVRQLLNEATRAGAEVVHDRMAPVHCSGHAYPSEQRSLLEWVRPKSFVPIHGDATMLETHARLARASGVPKDGVFVLMPGDAVALAEGRTICAARETVGWHYL